MTAVWSFHAATDAATSFGARATTSAVAAILKNPAYAGAFVYGRTRLRRPSDGKSAMNAAKPIGEWRIVVKGRYPAYIDWTAYEKIRGIVSDNRAEYMRNKTRAPHAMASCRCRASHGAPDAATRCTFATKEAPSTSATT
jgi:Recombinase